MLKEVISKRCYYVSLKYDPVWCNGSGVLCSVYHYCSCEFSILSGLVSERVAALVVDIRCKTSLTSGIPYTGIYLVNPVTLAENSVSSENIN
jgi:hypothetical protein